MRENDLIKRLRNIIGEYEEIILVLSFAILLGFINSIVDTQMLGRTYFQNMFRPNYFQILERLVFILIALLFGFVWHKTNKERKEKERGIHESELKYRSLAKTATDGIISIDESKNIIFINRAAEAIFGYSQDEIFGEDVKMLMPEEYRKRHDRGIRRYFETGNPKIIGKTIELEGLRKDGTKFPLELSLSVSELVSGCIFTAIIRDITERKKLEQGLEDYAAQLEDSNQQKELFLDIIRHDLLNPVGVIENVSDLIEEADSREEIQKELAMIKRSAEKVHGMIEAASKYAKLKSLDDLEFKNSDLSVFIKDAIEDLKDLANGKGITIKSNLGGSYFARVNPFIEDVFLNLLTNAIKFGPENSKVIVDIQDVERVWKIGIMDFGEGISDKHKENIFHRFERINKEGVEGYGLGLAIVKRIVDLHHGKVWVEDNSIEFTDEKGLTNKKKQGSIFYVTIPKNKT